MLVTARDTGRHPGSFDRQPRLENDAIRLRPLVENDWEALFAVASDPLIWAGHPMTGRWQEPVFRAFFAEALASRGALVAIDPATDAVIGSSRYDSSRVEPGEIEIGWTFLARPSWGGTANAAMKALMIRHALVHFPQVVFFVGDANMRSRRAMAKIGGVLTERRYDPTIGGVIVPHVVFAVDRAAFAKRPLCQPTPG